MTQGFQIEDEFRQACPDIELLTPSCNGFSERRTAFCGTDDSPSAIMCPCSEKDVQQIVRFLNTNRVPFTIRSGGHDTHGRSLIDGVVCIDMRNINFVEVSSDKASARIGGGILMSELSRDLEKHGLLTPVGSVSNIGYFGWASLGGYGTGTTHWGLGVDQIIAAQVVDHTGELKKADTSMLKAIKGSGGNVGIVTSLTIKVYPCRAVLADSIIIESATLGAGETFKQAMLTLQRLHRDGDITPELEIFPVVTNHPELGRFVMFGVFWTSNDQDKGRAVLETFRKGMPTAIISSNLIETGMADYMAAMDAFYAKTFWGGPETATFDELSPRALDLIGKHLEVLPKHLGTAFAVHMMFSESPSVTDKSLAESSCFPVEARRQHFMLECLGIATNKEASIDSVKWASALKKELVECGEASEGMYISLVGREQINDLDKIYGKNLSVVRELKKKFDPEGIFRYAVPRLV